MADDSTDAGHKDGSRQHKSFADVAHSWDDLKSVAHNEPCAREGFLYGIVSGVGVAVLRFFKRGNVMSAGNWGVLTFAGVAVVAKKLCHFQQAHQRAKVHTLLEMQSKVQQPIIKGFEPENGASSSTTTDQK
ncbi:hypothetical protein GGI12_003595 [Dipsacomyces acuminosporus]|nr:hypothetical protein GGI12_003595 [Dipsacomyces acuminosporus]